MNRWLYRAAGTVGIAGGFLLLGAGSAQADDPEGTEALLGDVFSPTSGLPPLDLAVDGTAAPDAGELTLDPQDGRLGEPELLGSLPALPVGGLDSLLNQLPLGGVPLDAVGVPGGMIGTGGPLATDDGQLRPDLVSVDGDLVGLPTRLADQGFRTLPAPAPLSPETAGPAAAADPAAGDPEIVGPMPFLTDPIKDSLLPGTSFRQLSMVGGLVGQVPVAGPIVNQNLRSLPLVHEIVPTQEDAAAGDPLTGPVADDQVAPVIGQQLAAEYGYDPELLGNGLPLIGDSLAPVGQMVGVGNLPSQLPLVGPLAGPLLGSLPVVGDADPAAVTPAVPLPNPLPDPSAERPIAGEDPEYAESGYPNSPEILPGLPGLPDPFAVLHSLPLVGPLAGSLPL